MTQDEDPGPEGPMKYFVTDDFSTRGEFIQEGEQVDPALVITNGMRDQLVLVFNEPSAAIEFAGQVTQAVLQLYGE